MDDLEHLEVLKRIEQLNSESANQVVVEALHEIRKEARVSR